MKWFARLTGVAFLLVGISGFFTELLFGLFHLGTSHNIIHLAVGVLGILSSLELRNAKLFAQGLGILYMLIGVLGVFVPDLFGLMHVGLEDNLLHLIVGAIALYFGFVIEEAPTPVRSAPRSA